MNPPVGTITFLFSDIEGSTRLWERFPDAMREALQRHDTILRETMANGFIFKTIGDAFCVAFDRAGDAVAAAANAQRMLNAESWGETGPLRVRMAIHVGAAEFRDNDYFGNSLNKVARLMAAAHGGQVLLSLPVEEMVRDHLADGVLLRDLGERRLRDLNRPEHVFQLVVDSLPADFPPLRTLETTPNNLPTLLNTFVGRSREREEIKRLLETTRLLTLTGTGGTGKTRLSLQVAEEILTTFHDGIWFVELAAINDPDRILESIASAVGLREEADEPLRERVSRFLCGRAMLVILDNCEHLIEACAELIGDLLKHCTTVKFLATSRHSLGVAGERTWPVPPMAVLNPSRDLFQVADVVTKVSQYEAVRLFIDRATVVKPAFQLTRQNAAAIAQICWRLDGIPLAIELAAARIRVLTPEQIAARLDDRFRLLTGGGRAVLPHQQTLRTLIDWSYDLLSEGERVLFTRLGVFGGGRTLDAIETVCSGDGVDPYETLDILQSLVDKSLLAVESGPDDEPRYTMIESVWHYAQERLQQSGEQEELRDRHLEFFLDLAEQAKVGLEGAEAAQWLDHVDAERVNFGLAMRWAAASPDRVQKGLRIAGSLTRYWEIRGNLEQARTAFETLLKAPGAESPTQARADALAGAARIAWVRDRSEIAMECYQAAVRIYKSLGLEREAILQETFLGFVERNLGRRDQNDARARRALDEGRARNDVALTAVALSLLGTARADAGDIDGSRRLREESLAIFRSRGDLWIMGYLLWGVAKACIAQSDPAAARNALDEWTSIARRFGNRWITPYVLQTFADVLLLEGEAALAARTLGAAEAGREALGITLDSADTEDWDATLSRLDQRIDGPTRLREWNVGRGMGVWEAIDAAAQRTNVAVAA